MNILYIYGYGSNSHSETAKLIQEVFCHDTVFCIDYPQDDVRTAIELLQNFVDENRIELVIASSYGAFVALFLNNVVKILINPCMSPSVELPKIDADPQVVQYATEYEMKMNEIPDANGVVTFGLFSDHDELLGKRYWEMFKQYGHVQEIRLCGHKANRDMLEKELLPCIGDMLHMRLLMPPEFKRRYQDILSQE